MINELGKAQNIVVADENLASWENTSGFNLLDEFYKDPKKWAFLFQTQVLLTFGKFEFIILT